MKKQICSQNKREIIKNFKGDSFSRNDLVSIKDIDIIESDLANNKKDTINPYRKREIIIQNRGDLFLRNNKIQGNRLKEKGYENSNYNSWNNISLENKRENSLIESKLEDAFNIQDISAISNRDVLNKYLHLFGDIENYATNNSKSLRSFFDTNRDDIDGDITNIRNTNVSSSNIQSKLQRLNYALNRRQLTQGRIDITKKGDINFNSDLFNRISKSVHKKII